MSKVLKTKINCVHCGDECSLDDFVQNDNHFCCNGCLMVYNLLSENGLSAYYQYEENPGISQRKVSSQAFDYLDDEQLITKLLTFREGGISKVKLSLPQIHCSSCLWLLENISKLDAGIISSRVNFTSKEATITYRENDISLRSVVEILTSIGYEPRINYDQLDKKHSKSYFDKKLIYKLGLAGFSFGNIMLLSFPEYLGFEKASYLFYLGYINIVLATPVLLYSGSDYLKSAWKGIKLGNLNIDTPIAIGMLTLYFRSVFDIISHQGEGYLDSFAGFVFFLLIGRWFQSYTYKALDFDRNYKAYFPLSATIRTQSEWKTKSLDNVMPGDILLIRNLELIPADSILQKGNARIDYSFVTGESDLISKGHGEALYAGGRHQGESIEVLVTKKVDQSHLTQLWNDDAFKERSISNSGKLINSISKYFTYIILAIAVTTMVYWWYQDSGRAVNIFTAVLIVACPCALALSIPFTYGNILRLLATKGFYLKNVSTIEDIQDIDHIIFDKTGTLTDNKKINITYHGTLLNEDTKILIKSACAHSSHPLSKAIVTHLSDTTLVDIDSFRDEIGSGIIAHWNGWKLKLGSSSFIFGTEKTKKERGVFIEVDGIYLGYFQFEHGLRDNIENVINGLSIAYDLSVLSGDADDERLRMQSLFGDASKIYFNHSPQDKLDKIKELQSRGHRVMMIGDGLNDAGALKQSNVGIVISDESNNFSPACDGILDASEFSTLLRNIQYLKFARNIIYVAFGLAFLYNSIGLYFAISGRLSPVIAAILMPLSSITIILYGISASYLGYQYFTRKSD